MTAKETAIAFKKWCDRNERTHNWRFFKTHSAEELFEHFMQEQNNRTDQTTKG
jgi:hypothetical protein